MRSPRMAIAPLSITRRCGSMVTTERPVQIQSADSAASAEMKSRKLQKRRIEWPWEKIFQAEGFRLAVEVGEHQFHIAAELPEDLAASAAGVCQRVGIGHNGHAPELACAFGDRLEDSHALGAEGQAVSGVLDVAAGVDAPREVLQRRAHFELGERRMGILPGAQCGFYQRVHLMASTTIHQFLRGPRRFQAAALLRSAILVRSMVRIAVIASRPWEVTW